MGLGRWGWDLGRGAGTFWHSAFWVDEVVLACCSAAVAALGRVALEVVLSLPPPHPATNRAASEQRNGQGTRGTHGGQA